VRWRRKRSAVLLDFDNVVAALGKPLVTNIAQWMAWLENGEFDPAGQRRRFVLKRVYWSGTHEPTRDAFEQAGFDTSFCRAVRKEKSSSADFVMTIDAMDLSYQSGGLDEIILLTFDSDFLPLVNRLELNKIETAAMIDPKRIPSLEYQRHADLVIHIDCFRDAMIFTPPPSRLFRRRPPPCGVAPVEATRMPARGVPRKPPPVRQARPVKPRAPVFDLNAVAERIAEVAQSIPGGKVGKSAVRSIVEQVEGFTLTGASAWLGCGSYLALIQRLVTLHPALKLWRHSSNGGIAIVYRPRDSERVR